MAEHMWEVAAKAISEATAHYVNDAVPVDGGTWLAAMLAHCTSAFRDACARAGFDFEGWRIIALDFEHQLRVNNRIVLAAQSPDGRIHRLGVGDVAG